MVSDTKSEIHENPYPNSVKILVDLPTLNSCNFFVFKYFLDRKKVLKSLEANSSISPQNYVIPARYHTQNHMSLRVDIGKIGSSRPNTRTSSAEHGGAAVEQ